MAGIIIRNWEDCDRNVAILRELDAHERRAKADKDEAIRAASAPHDAGLARIAKNRKPIAQAVAKFCRKHRKDFGDEKSRQLDSGVVGWRLGNRTLGLLNKAKDWATALVKVLGAGRTAYVRVIRELAKDRILADHKAGRLSDGQLAAWDLRVTQCERFFVEPKTDDGRDRQADTQE